MVVGRGEPDASDESTSLQTFLVESLAPVVARQHAAEAGGFSFSIRSIAVSMSWPTLGSLARSWMCCQRACGGTQNTLWLVYSSRSSMNFARRASLGM